MVFSDVVECALDFCVRFRVPCDGVAQELVGCGFGRTCRLLPGLGEVVSPVIGFVVGAELALPSGGLDALELGSGDDVSLSDGEGDGETVGLGESGGAEETDVLGVSDGADDAAAVMPGDDLAAGAVLQPDLPGRVGAPDGYTGRTPWPVVLDVPVTPWPPPAAGLPPGPTGEFELFGNRLCGASKAT